MCGFFIYLCLINSVNIGFDVKDTFFRLDLRKDFELKDDLILDLKQNTNSISTCIINEVTT